MLQSLSLTILLTAMLGGLQYTHAEHQPNDGDSYDFCLKDAHSRQDYTHWSSATDWCAQANSFVLLYLHSEQDYLALQGSVRSEEHTKVHDGNFWLGLSINNKTSAMWNGGWSRGRQFIPGSSFHMFRDGNVTDFSEPLSRGTLCAYVNTNESVWEWDDCSRKHHALCRLLPQGRTSPYIIEKLERLVTIGETLNIHCRADVFDDRFLRFDLFKDNTVIMSFDEHSPKERVTYLSGGNLHGLVLPNTCCDRWVDISIRLQITPEINGSELVCISACTYDVAKCYKNHTTQTSAGVIYVKQSHDEDDMPGDKKDSFFGDEQFYILQDAVIAGLFLFVVAIVSMIKRCQRKQPRRQSEPSTRSNPHQIRPTLLMSVETQVPPLRGI